MIQSKVKLLLFEIQQYLEIDGVNFLKVLQEWTQFWNMSLDLIF